MAHWNCDIDVEGGDQRRVQEKYTTTIKGLEDASMICNSHQGPRGHKCNIKQPSRA